MSYVSFLLKKIRKNKLNFIPFFLALIFIVFMYYCHQLSAYGQINNPELSGENEIATLEASISHYQNAIALSDETSEYHQIALTNLKRTEQEVELLQQKLDAIKNEDWQAYNKYALALTNIKLDFFETDKTTDNTLVIDVLKTNRAFYQYMLDHTLGFDDRFANIQGMTFMVRTFKYYAPVILAILLIYLVSSLYCSTHIDNMDIQKLLPLSPFNRQKSRMIAGTITGGCIVLFIAVIAIICGTVRNTMGNLSSPVLTYTLQGANSYVSLLSVLPQFLILQCLSIIFIVNLISLISLITRKQLLCMLVSLIIIVGCLLGTTNIVQLQPYMHLLPTSYLNSFQVISGEFSFLTGNTNVNFLFGLLILSLSNAILLLLYYYLPQLFHPKVIDH